MALAKIIRNRSRFQQIINLAKAICFLLIVPPAKAGGNSAKAGGNSAKAGGNSAKAGGNSKKYFINRNGFLQLKLEAIQRK